MVNAMGYCIDIHYYTITFATNPKQGIPSFKAIIDANVWYILLAKYLITNIDVKISLDRKRFILRNCQ